MQEFKAIFSLLGSSRLMGNFINKEQLQSVCVDLMLTLTFSISLTLAAGTTSTRRRGSETGSPSLGSLRVVVICVLHHG